MSSFSSSSWAYSSSSSSNSSSTLPLYPNAYEIKPISDEDFNIFHEVDRELFSHLIFSHGREAHETMLVMAVWIWLERANYCPIKLAKTILWNLSPPEISVVARETVKCLEALQSDLFSFSGNDEEIANLQILMEHKRLRLRDLFVNRANILPEVLDIARDICGRAFKDILQSTFGTSVVFKQSNNEARDQSSSGNRFGTSVVSNNHIEGSSSSSSSRFRAFTPPAIGVPSYPRPNVGQQLGFSEVPHFVPDEVDGHGNGILGMPGFVPNEGGGHGNEMSMPPFVPNEAAGVHWDSGMGVQQFVPNEGVQVHRNTGMGVQQFVPNEGVQVHRNTGMRVPQFVPNEGAHHGMNRMGTPPFVPNGSDVHRLAAMGMPNHVVVHGHHGPSHMVGFGQQGPNQNLAALYQLRHQQELHREFVNNELEKLMSLVHISVRGEEDVPADDRTIFLTFSKGYPISENEVRNFFTRRFGPFIEAIFMQDVPPNEQALYARIVAHRPSDLDKVLGTESKAKFSINGKHVWARKYVRNSPRTHGQGGPVR